MSMITDMRNAFCYLASGQWGQFALRLKVFLGIIDLKVDAPGATPTERTHPYSNSGGLYLEKVLDSLDISPGDAVVDFGSGKGGALITFSKYPFSRITGVELCPELSAVARENLRKLGIGNVRLETGDAAGFTDLDGYNFFYFFNPFPGEVMRTVVRNIESSLVRKPRKATIIYLNPEYHLEVTAGSSFSKVFEYDHHPLGFYIYTNRA